MRIGDAIIRLLLTVASSGCGWYRVGFVYDPRKKEKTSASVNGKKCQLDCFIVNNKKIYIYTWIHIYIDQVGVGIKLQSYV